MRSLFVGLLLLATAIPVHALSEPEIRAMAEAMRTDRALAPSLNQIGAEAEKGSPEAAYALGMFFREGQFVRQDLKQAVEWFTFAAEHEQAGSQFQLYLLYQRGEGVTRDQELAFRWLRAAVQNRYAPALEALADRYFQMGTKATHRILAHALYRLAQQEGGSMSAVDHLPVLETRMTPTEIKTALQLFDDLDNSTHMVRTLDQFAVSSVKS